MSSYHHVTVPPPPGKCPGLYCGRMPTDDLLAANLTGTTTASAWSACGACPQGYRVHTGLEPGAVGDSSICMPCLDEPAAYDWLYLGFMAVVPLILHWFSIDMAARSAQFTRAQLLLHACATVEVVLAAVLALLAFEPYGTLRFHACSVTRLSDWYTLFHNPTPNYDAKLYCTQEAVYPL